MSNIAVLLIDADEQRARVIADLLESSVEANFTLSRRPSIEGIGRSSGDAVVLGVESGRATTDLAELARLAPGLPVFGVGATAPESLLATLRRQGMRSFVPLDAIPALPALIAFAVDRTRAETRSRRLVEQRNEVQALLSAVLDLVRAETVITGPDGGLVAVNPAFSASFGWQMKDAAQTRLSEILTEEPGGSGRLRHKDGRDLPVRVRSSATTVEGRSCRVLTFELLVETLASVKGSGDPVFRARVAELLRAGGKLVAGQLQLVTLDDVRQTLGERWEKMAERIYDTADHIIRSRLSPEDVFTRNDAGQFVVCFARLGEAEAWFKARAIQQEIAERLLGEKAGGALAAVSVETHEVELSPEEVRDTTDFADLIATKLWQRAEQLRKDSERALAEIADSCELKPRVVLSAVGKPSGFEIAELDPQSQARVERLAAIDEDWKLLSQIDAMMLGSAAQHLFRHLSPRQDRMLVVPVRFSTLYNRKLRDKYLSICRQLPMAARQSLVFAVRAIPEDILSARVSDLLNALRPYSRFRMVHLDGARLGTLSPRDALVSLIGIDEAVLTTAAEHDPLAVHRLRGAIKAANAKLLVDRVASPAGLSFARQAGADLVAFAAMPQAKHTVRPNAAATG